MAARCQHDWLIRRKVAHPIKVLVSPKSKGNSALGTNHVQQLVLVSKVAQQSAKRVIVVQVSLCDELRIHLGLPRIIPGWTIIEPAWIKVGRSEVRDNY